MLFLRSGPRDFAQSLYQVKLPAGEERLLLSAARLLGGADEEIDAAEKARRERQRVVTRGITSFRLSRDGARLLVPLSGRLFVVDRASGKVRELGASGGYPIDPRFSPDGRKVSCVRLGDLYVIDLASGRQRRLTRRGTHPPPPAGFAGDHAALSHGLAEFVAQEEMRRHRGYWWSPDSKQLAFQQTDSSQVETLYIADPHQPAAKPRSVRYPRAGKANASVRLGLIAATGGPVRWVRWDATRYPYLAKVVWSGPGPLTLLVQSRRQTEATLLAVDRGGATRSLLVERDEAWLNIDPSVPRWLPDGSGFLWSTERRGSWQLELRDRRGALVRAVTEADLGYRQLLHLAPAGDRVYVSASREPTERHLHAVPLSNPAGAVQLSHGAGEHEAVFARRSGLFVESAELLDGSASVRVRRLAAGQEIAAGQELAALRSVAERPPYQPKLQLVKVGKQQLRAALVRPRGFVAGRKYPVLVYVYGGPHHRTVRALPRRYLIRQWLADQGPFVVVSIDGRGTPGRGRSWERALKGDMARVPLADQVAGLRALGGRFAELDLSRVGVFGWSYGGYLAAMSVLRHPEVYRAAVAVAPVTDWHDYDTHYTERYLGLPAENAAGYRASSALTHASRLARPLLLVHGTADDNVYFSHSLRLSRALFLAGRQHEFLPLSGFTHMVPDPRVTRRLYRHIARFFRQRLHAPAD